MAENTPKDIAVIGAGISGITAAYLLSRQHKVVLYDGNNYLGGHTNTRVVSADHESVCVDTGFIVCNRKNYPNFYKLLKELSVSLRDAVMTFGFYDSATNFHYQGPGVGEFLSTPKNFLKLRYWRMIYEWQRFNREMLRELRSGKLAEIPLGQYLKEKGYSHFFIEHYLTPLIASIWSSPDTATYDFPTTTFATFFNNHGMLDMRHRPQWQTIVGGSHAYVEAFKKKFPGEVQLNNAAIKIVRTPAKVIVHEQQGASRKFDAVVIATHANQALELLDVPTPEERQLLSSWKYNTNSVVLHTDTKVMQVPKAYWASWNYSKPLRGIRSSPVAITYYMNKLQGLQSKIDYFVTLNPSEKIAQTKIIYEVDYTHPIYTSLSVASQKGLQRINGCHNTYYCGAYLGYGFHEDGVVSAQAVCAKFGLSL